MKYTQNYTCMDKGSPTQIEKALRHFVTPYSYVNKLTVLPLKNNEAISTVGLHKLIHSRESSALF